MTLITHSPDTLALAARKAFEVAYPVARLAEAALVVVVVDANDAIHYQSSRPPTMTAGMMTTEPDPIATATDDPDSLDALALDAFEAARVVADEHCVGLVVIVADGKGQRVCRRSSVAAVLTAGMLHRAASLHDIKPPPMFVPFAALAPSQTTGLPQPGGGVAGGGPQAATGVGGPLPPPAVWDGQPRNAESQTPAPDAPAASSPPAPSDERPN